jgi:hypothetical protein
MRSTASWATIAVVAAGCGLAPSVFAQPAVTPDWAFSPTGGLAPMVMCQSWTRTGGDGTRPGDWGTNGPSYGPTYPGTSVYDGDLFGGSDQFYVDSTSTNSRFTFYLRNFKDNFPTKLFFLEIHTNSLNPAPVPVSLVGYVGSNSYPHQPGPMVENGPNSRLGYHQTWVMHPNPWWEAFYIDVGRDGSGNCNAKSFTFYTVSIPAPATLAGLGALAPLAFRRRRA